MIYFFIVLLFLLFLINYNYNENFTINNNDINFYVITLKNEERIKNINLQKEILNTNINLIDGIKGNTINQDQLLHNKILTTNFYFNNLKRNNEIGCYLSHLKIYDLIKQNINNTKYSVIFEDDFKIISKNITYDLNLLINNINNIDFDIIFLGNTFDNVDFNNKITENIFKIDTNKNTIGTFAYLINNKNIDKLIELIKIIDSPIDVKLDNLIKNNFINAYVIYPNLVSYNHNLSSEIITND
jgi:GR25 family glycosyltransferase involved in LPS biosynthesis